MSSRMLRLLKWVGYPLFALFAFVVAFYLMFPYDKVKTRVEDFLSATGDMEVSIAELGPSPLTGVKAMDLVVRIKDAPGQGGVNPADTVEAAEGAEGGKKAAGPKGPKGASYSRVLLDEVRVGVGLLALLSGSLDITFDVEGLGGTLEGEFSSDKKKKDWSVKAAAEDIKLGQAKILSKKLGLPLMGGLSAEVDLKVPGGKMNEASGTLRISCKGCSLGDGKKKLKIKGNAFLSAGITLPKLRMGKMSGEVKVDKGEAKIQSFSAKSPDLELKLEGSVQLRQPMGFSVLNGYLRFKVSDALKEKNPAFGLLDTALGNAKRPDGFFGMKVFGNLKNPKFLPSRVGPPKRGDLGSSSGNRLAQK